MPTLDWIGKKAVLNYHNKVPYRQLAQVAGESQGDTDSGNLLVEGDNLEALQALLPAFEGQIKLIYIDPPYNTGNESWVYNDNVNSPEMRTWLAKVVGKESEDLSRQDKWLCMMYPRLQLLKRLLRPDGSLWMSLDDNSQHLGRMLLDEVFGAINFVSTVIWEKSDSPKMDADYFSPNHEYIFCYALNKPKFTVNKFANDEDDIPDHYDRTDEDGKIYYLKPLRAMGGQGDTQEARPTLHYELEAPDSTMVFPIRQDGSGGAWRWKKEKYEREKWRIEWNQGRNGWIPYYRIYAENMRPRPPETIWPHQEVGSGRTAKTQIKKAIKDAKAFDTPKPLGLIQRILQIATNPQGSPDSRGEIRPDIVLDSYAGSGTTGHAVLKQNAEDKGNRRFVLVQMADEGSPEAPKPIARPITAKRLKYAVEQHGGGFNFLTLGETLFEADGRIKEGIGYDALARYVFHVATGEAWNGQRDGPLLGRASNGVGVYLLYNGVLKDKHPQSGNVLTRDVLASLPATQPGDIVYGTACRLTASRLSQLGLIFRQIPYALKGGQ
ncbi:site-specific DNA-methyltransferase [Deinococcus petrolearius]|uniref:Site-specific DNA-methyltransferase n=1 Tax=Deinococcus petrolearius TaxID=1751295 RepID=A0ABW1DKW2_9DEIO